MRITRHIVSLLFDYECVVIPGFGGFITKEHRAEIHPVKHQFKPPYKEVVFNPQLRSNDGLLLNSISLAEKISHQYAGHLLERFVLKCQRDLDNGKRIVIPELGLLYYDKRKQIVFEPDQSQNFLSSSFGLAGFVSPSIQREGFQEKLGNAFIERRREKQIITAAPDRSAAPKQHGKALPNKRKRLLKKASTLKFAFKRPLFMVGIILLFIFTAFAILNQQFLTRYYNSYAGLVPFFYSSPNEYLIRNLEAIPIEKFLRTNNQPETPHSKQIESSGKDVPIPAQLNVKPDDLGEQKAVNDFSSTDKINYDLPTETGPMPAEDAGNSERNQKPQAASEAQELSENIRQNQLSGYHIVAGAFREKDNADKLLAQLLNKGYNAQFSGRTNSGLWRVSFEVLSSRSQAIERLAVIKSSENPQAWLLKL
jgi:hypothetical protein